MDFYKVLDIEKEFLKSEHYSGLAIAVRTWLELGSPVTKTALSNALDQAINRSRQHGVRYPPILLKRKRCLDRGEWAPKIDLAVEHGSAASKCEKCGGSGTRPDSLLGMTLCECNSWDKSKQRV